MNTNIYHMFDNGTKFRYFYKILKEIYTIIEINYEIKDTELPKLLKIIESHLNMYNSKNGMLQMSCRFDTENGMLEVYLSDYVIGRGRKKKFNDTISIQSLIREKLIDDLLYGKFGEEEEGDMKLYE